MNRRRFLTLAGAASALPVIVPSRVFGAAGRPAPSERITMGVVGWGMQGPGNTRAFLNQPDCQVIAACDVDRRHLANAVGTINRHYQNEDCRAYADYRDLLAREDIDTVMLAVPDNWHALTSIDAANAGKDIYGEKPLARTLTEQQAIVDAVQRNRRIWQTGAWQRSQENFHKAAEIVRNGLIGKVSRIEVGLPAGHTDFARTGDQRSITDPPDELDYDRWIGPSRMQPYIPCRVHMNWRWDYNIGGGQLLDWVGHHADIAHWGMDWDAGGPLNAEGTGEFPPPDAVWNTCTRYRIRLEYPGGVEMLMAGGHRDIRGGTRWIGDQGWVWVDRGRFDASEERFKEMSRLPDDLRKIPLYHSRNHQRNFLDCVRSRQPTITPVETAHHSAVPGHLGLIAMLVGRRIRWDAAAGRILDDPGATGLMSRPYRAPWTLG